MEPASGRYTNFEDLSQPTVDIKESTRLLFSENWEDNFKSITQLRAFSKHSWEEFKYYQLFLKPRIFQLAASLRSTLAKNTLMLITEMLNEFREDFDITDILIMLLSRSSVEKSFLKSEVINGIQNGCFNYPSLANCEAILMNSFSKSLGIVKISLKFLDLMVGKLGKDEKFKILLLLADGKRQEHSVIAKKILVELELTWDDIHNNLQGLNQKQSSWISSLKATKNHDKISIKDAIKQKKENLINEIS